MKSITLGKIIHLLIICFFCINFCSCQKEMSNDINVPMDNTSYVLDSIVTEEQPAAVCSGCRYLVRGIKNYVYNKDGKVWKILSVSNYSNNRIAYDTTILEISNGRAFQSNYGSVVGSPEQPTNGKRELGLLSNFNTVLASANVTRSYQNNLPNAPGAADTLESGVSDIAYDGNGRLTTYAYQYYQTILTKTTYPLERKVITFPYKIIYQNDKDGLLKYQQVMKIIDDDQRKLTASDNWLYLKNYYFTNNGINYYSPYFRKEEISVDRTNYKLINPPLLFYTELPDIYLINKKTTSSYISADTTKGWTLIKTGYTQNLEITTNENFVSAYKVFNQDSKMVSTVRYYFRKI